MLQLLVLKKNKFLTSLWTSRESVLSVKESEYYPNLMLTCETVDHIFGSDGCGSDVTCMLLFQS